jgi:alpha/beta superfamily hydrolase
MIRSAVLISICLLFVSVSQAGNSKREQEYADILNNTLKMGKIVWLQAQGRKFLSIYTETVQINNRGTAIILHDRTGYPDQQYLIHGLRTVLPQHNWATLSLQMPVREMGASESEHYVLFEEAKARIEAAVAYLRQDEVKNIVMIGYGLGAMMGLYTASENNNDFNGIVAISLAVPETGHKLAQTLSFINNIQLPFLDIYAELDLPEVVDSARKRKLAAKENSDFRQVKIAGADHLFQHNHSLIVKRVYSWLRRTFKKQ